jgi:bifunctional DNA-binding transcriptional regulator/antitoxin component of YhaV-PrlF toxin-antitoxin module
MEKCGGAAIGSMGWPTREWPEGPTLERNALLHYIRVSQSGDSAMTTLTVTARGQVTFRKDVLQHLGIKPGEKIELDLLPDGRAELKASRPKGSFRDLLLRKSMRQLPRLVRPPGPTRNEDHC